MSTPEHNMTGLDFGARSHLRADVPPLIDIHAHVTRTKPPDTDGTPSDLAAAEIMLDVAREFGVERIYSMCPPEDIPPLRQRFGARIGFNGSIVKKLEEPDEVAEQLLERFLEQGVEIIKFWSAPRGRDRGLFVDAPWRIAAARRRAPPVSAS